MDLKKLRDKLPKEIRDKIPQDLKLPENLNTDGVKDYIDHKKKTFDLKHTFRAATEFKEFMEQKAGLLANAPKGDGHPVLVIPAFSSNDVPTKPLRQLLQEAGYKVYGWENGFNFGMTEAIAEKVRSRLEQVYRANGNQKVTIIGHSLGGFYARALAQEFPEMVRGVVTVNTPFGIGAHRDQTPAHMITMIQKLGDERYNIDDKDISARLLTPPEKVPTTSIFSKIDKTAGWKACLNPETPLSENVEVSSTHLGSIWHRDTLAVILDRLGQPAGDWKRHHANDNVYKPEHPGWTPGKKADWRFFKKPGL
jgi:pimeloyl-ACP methyl ester carboxylesterase